MNLGFVEAGELEIALFAAKIAKWRIEPKAKEFISNLLRQIGLYLAHANAPSLQESSSEPTSFFTIGIGIGLVRGSTVSDVH